jgi:hypothetical protein
MLWILKTKLKLNVQISLLFGLNTIEYILSSCWLENLTVFCFYQKYRLQPFSNPIPKNFPLWENFKHCIEVSAS